MSSIERQARISIIKQALQNPEVTLNQLQTVQEETPDPDLKEVIQQAISAFQESSQSTVFHTLVKLLDFKSSSGRVESEITTLIERLTPDPTED